MATQGRNGVHMLPARVWRDGRGVTGLETAIVLIAFVVVASVFAYAVLSVGLVSTEKTKDVVETGIQEASSTLILTGSVVAVRSATTTTEVGSIRFHIASATQSGEAVTLVASGANATIVTYIDENSLVNSTDWTATWLSGSGPLLHPGEAVEIDVPLGSLNPPLGVSSRFSVELKPPVGPTLKIKRATPPALTPITDLN